MMIRAGRLPCEYFLLGRYWVLRCVLGRRLRSRIGLVSWRIRIVVLLWILMGTVLPVRLMSKRVEGGLTTE